MKVGDDIRFESSVVITVVIQKEEVVGAASLDATTSDVGLGRDYFTCTNYYAIYFNTSFLTIISSSTI